MIMADIYVHRLRKNYEPILRDLEPRQVLNYLYQEDVIDGDVRDEIRAERTRTKQAEILLDYLERRGASAIQYFIEGLQKSSQKHLAEILTKPLANESTGRSQGSGNPVDCYPMDRNPRGIAIIINNFQFKENAAVPLCKRYGSEIDVVRMKLLFQWLKFDIKEHEDCTAAEMKRHVRALALEDHTKYDCCVLILMSHGLEAGVYGTDGEVITLKFITGCLSAKFSPTLANKPKLIFVQACRGGQPDKGVDVCECPNDTNAPLAQESNANVLPALSGLKSLDTRESGLSSRIPIDADIFIAFASSFDHAALRNTINGGWFVDKLYTVLRNNAKEEDLLSMMIKVNNAVAEKKGDASEMQCPQQWINLRKKLYFFPKVVNKM